MAGAAGGVQGAPEAGHPPEPGARGHLLTLHPPHHTGSLLVLFLLFVRRIKRWKDFTHANTKTLINRTSDGLVERVIMCFSPEIFCYMYVDQLK